MHTYRPRNVVYRISMLQTKSDIVQLIEEDAWMMEILRAAAKLRLPDWWIGAGFVRAKVWDVLHGYKERTPLGDIDLIYFDPTNLDEAVEKKYDSELQKAFPGVPWSVKNQARMHLVNGDMPYESSIDAVMHWPDTPTCVAVKLSEEGELILEAPYGIFDIVHMIARPSPKFTRRMEVFRDRMKRKNWVEKWPKVRVMEM